MKAANKKFWFLLAWSLACFALPCQGQNQVLDRVAREVCLDIGIRAEISGLDDITLTTQQGDGESGATYSGADTFFLESNAPVRLMLSAAPINNGLNTLPTDYRIDGIDGWLETSGNGPHAGRHSLSVKAQLGSISDQLAGRYSSTLMITVVPQIPEISRCLETETTIEPALDNSQLELDVEIVSEAMLEPNFSNKNIEPLPPWAAQIMEQPQADSMFPFLTEYQNWLNGQVPTLSEQAKNWWLFPVDRRVFDALGISTLNNR